ncbi:MAG: hypothetical protein WC238_04715 [Parcubacteria group bacterium]|jgi:hypothetical protein
MSNLSSDQNSPSQTKDGKPRKPRKLTDKQFLDILRANAGLYARTARAITEKYGLAYSRQSVRDRAQKFPAEETDIQEQMVDVAEETLIDIMRGKDKKIALRAAESYLKAKGKLRGYGDSLDLTSGNKPIEPFSGVLPIHKPKQEDNEG